MESRSFRMKIVLASAVGVSSLQFVTLSVSHRSLLQCVWFPLSGCVCVCCDDSQLSHFMSSLEVRLCTLSGVVVCWCLWHLPYVAWRWGIGVLLVGVSVHGVLSLHYGEQMVGMVSFLRHRMAMVGMVSSLRHRMAMVGMVSSLRHRSRRCVVQIPLPHHTIGRFPPSAASDEEKGDDHCCR